MLAFLGLHFNHTWDLTAAGTLALAVLTLVTLIVSAVSLRQTRKAINVSRREVEEAHRPVVVPIADRRRMEFAGPGGPPSSQAKPWVTDGILYVPIENVGTGPGLDIEATAELLSSAGDWSAAGGGEQLGAAAALGASSRIAMEIKFHGLASMTGFWLTLTYSDVAGKEWATKARYIPDRGRYEDLTINPLTDGVYGLRQNTDLVKPVTPDA